MTNTTSFSSYRPVEDLLSAAREALKLLDKVTIPGVEKVRPQLQRALVEVDETVALRNLRYQAHIDLARKRYADPSSDDIEVDDTPLISHTDEGCWISGWLWVADESVAEPEDDE
jgi:hypothetical protein